MGQVIHKRFLLAVVTLVIACNSSIAAYANEQGHSLTVPVKARIIRCVSQVERINMCNDQNLCCHLVDDMTAISNNHYKASDPPQPNTQSVYEATTIRLTLNRR